MKASVCRLVVGVALGVLTPWAPAFAQSASQPAADPMAKSVESAREAKSRWLDTAKATSPFQPKGDSRWPPDPTPAPGAFEATGQTYAAGNSYTPRGTYTRDNYTPRNTYSPLDWTYRVSDQNATLSWTYGGYSYRSPSPSTAPPYYPTTVTRASYVRSFEAPRPGNVDVFVDNRMYGTIDSVSRMGGLQLPPGPHRVEMRAVGFNSSAYNVSVGLPVAAYYRPVSAYYSGPFVPVAAPYYVPTYVSYPTYVSSYPTFNGWPIGSFGGPLRAPRSVYVVSKCYAGDEPPKDYQLPAGCTGPATPAR